jgi:MFS-type transporter involved in bile tolerance (Atg22 family)
MRERTASSQLFPEMDQTAWRAYVMSAASRGSQGINAALYNSLALNFIARAVEDQCGMIFGGRFSSSSVVSVYVTVTLINEMTLVPTIASRLDGTPYRFMLFRFTHVLWVALVVVGGLFNRLHGAPTEGGLVLYFISLVLVSLNYELSGVLLGAYLPELAAGESEITRVTSQSQSLSSAMGLLLAVVVTVLSSVLGPWDNLALSEAACLGVLVFWLLWGLPGLRALSLVETSMTLGTGAGAGARTGAGAGAAAGVQAQTQLPPIEPKWAAAAAAAGSAAPTVAVESLAAERVPVLTPEPSSQASPASPVSLTSSSEHSQRTNILKMAKLIWNEYHDMGYFLVAVALYLPAVGNLIILATGYLQNRVGMTGGDISLLSIIVVVVSVPSAYLTRAVQYRVGIKRTLVGAVLLWTALATITPWTVVSELVPLTGNVTTGEGGASGATANAAAALNQSSVEAICGMRIEATTQVAIPPGFKVGPTSGTKALVMIYATLWGFGIGVVYSATIAIFAVMIPGGKEASFMGVRSLAGKIIAWAPSMLYTVINETTGNLDMAMLSVCAFLWASLPFLFSINLKRAKSKASENHSMRRRCTLNTLPKSSKSFNKIAPVPALVDHKEEGPDY